VKPGSNREFVFVVISVALGAAALTAVTGFNESVRYTLVREARTLMAADMALRMPVQPSPQELRFLDELAAKGVESTRVTETVSMASASVGEQPPILISVKGADFTRYPFTENFNSIPPALVWMRTLSRYPTICCCASVSTSATRLWSASGNSGSLPVSPANRTA